MSRSSWLAVLLIAGCMDPHGPGSSDTTTSSPDATSTGSEGSTTTPPDSSSSIDASSSADSAMSADADAETTSDPDTGDATTSEGPYCGDGNVDPGEECDLGYVGNANDAYCLYDCTKATCGDGYVFAGNEECDDANSDPADGCAECGRTRKVFVTSETYQGAQFMGLIGADQRCRSLAAQADLPNFATYVAWLSDSRTAARDRMVHGKGRYELVNGLLVANNWADLVDGELLIPINVTETSETYEPGVWTGTLPDGQIAPGSDHCADWTAQEFENSGYRGSAQTSDAQWTLVDSPVNPGDCGATSALYCFEQD
jgi:cysteine-rich repeat protein